MSDRHPAWDEIEAGAEKMARHTDLPPNETMIQLSIAISLKRIADALETSAGLSLIAGAVDISGDGGEVIIHDIVERAINPFRGEKE